MLTGKQWRHRFGIQVSCCFHPGGWWSCMHDPLSLNVLLVIRNRDSNVKLSPHSWPRTVSSHHIRVRLIHTILNPSVLTPRLQLLSGGCRRTTGVRYSQTCNICQCYTVAEGAARPRWLEHCHYARRQQEWPETLAGCANWWGKGIFKYVWCFVHWVTTELDGLLPLAENGLSFIETSALDASNVESAFQTILTGMPPVL